jgi:hypothetical protein
MVRFQWHVEDGLGASVGPGQLVYLRDHGVLQAMVEIEVRCELGVADSVVVVHGDTSMVQTSEGCNQFCLAVRTEPAQQETHVSPLASFRCLAKAAPWRLV